MGDLKAPQNSCFRQSWLHIFTPGEPQLYSELSLPAFCAGYIAILQQYTDSQVVCPARFFDFEIVFGLKPLLLQMLTSPQFPRHIASHTPQRRCSCLTGPGTRLRSCHRTQSICIPSGSHSCHFAALITSLLYLLHLTS